MFPKEHYQYDHSRYDIIIFRMKCESLWRLKSVLERFFKVMDTEIYIRTKETGEQTLPLWLRCTWKAVWNLKGWADANLVWVWYFWKTDMERRKWGKELHLPYELGSPLRIEDSAGNLKASYGYGFFGKTSIRT